MSLYGKLDTNSNAPKYLDRGQIPAVNVTAGGTGYTTVPTVTIAAPAAPTGIQATGTARMGVVTVPSISGGSGYAVGDVLTLVGGTGTAALLKVLTVSTTAVATVEILNPGSYSALPANVAAVAVTGGSGTAATFSVTFKVVSITVTNPGAGYVAGDAAGVTFGSGVATATVAKHGNAFVSGQNTNQVVIFVSADEAALDTNKKKGLTSPGWWLFRTYVDSTGVTRYKSEMLANITNTETTDAADDAIAADVDSTVTFGTQPTAQLVANEQATFTVAATSAPSGTVSYQWQKKVPGGRWANVSNKIAASAVFTGLVAADNGNLYRAVAGNDIGALKVYSNSALLTYVPTYISVQPLSGDTETGTGNITFTVTAVAPSGTLSYAWETLTAPGTWVAAGTDSDTLALTGLTVANDNDEVRVTISNSNGDPDVVSNVAVVNYIP